MEFSFLIYLLFLDKCVSPGKKKDKIACEWKGKENPCCFKVHGLFKDLGDLWAEIHLFAALTCSLPVN